MKQKLFVIIMCLSFLAASVITSVPVSSSQSQSTLLCSDFEIYIGKI